MAMSKTKAILQAVFDEAPPTSACPDCQANLSAYVEAELDGQPAASLYPAVAEHLATCVACAAEYHDLVSLLTLERRGMFEQPPRPAAFDFGYLPPPPATSPAQPAGRPWRLDALGRLVVQFSADLVRSLQRPALQPAYLKSGTEGGFEWTLVEGLDDLQVSIHAEPQARQPERVDLTVNVDIPSRGGWPNLAGSIVTLRREAGELVEVQETDAFGQAAFVGVTAEDLSSLVVEITPASP